MRYRLPIVAPLLFAGCTSIFPSSLFTTSGDVQPLLPEAKALRAAAPYPAPVPRELDKQQMPPYVVEPGDVLLVTPTDFESNVRLSGDQPVLPDGRIDLGRFGRPVVAGKTLDEIDLIVRDAVLSQEPNAGRVLVRIVSRQSKVYYVLGQVNAPGAFPLQGRETVLDGLMAAGGLNIRAAASKIILSRPTGPGCERIVLPVCYKQIVQLGDATTNYQLQPGDRIFVPGTTGLESIFPDKHSDDCPFDGCKKH